MKRNLKNFKETLKHENGITLVALVITIVILIILATVAIQFAFGNNGLINRASDAKEYYANDTAYTEDSLSNVESYIDGIIGENGKEEGTLEPDEGKEALIFTIRTDSTSYELPVRETKQYQYNFNVDWGDGSKTEGITNSNLDTKAKHEYSKPGNYDIKIEGTYECVYTYDDLIIELKQWGTTNIKEVYLFDKNLERISSPTQSSFENLKTIEISSEKLTSIPENLFADCPNVTSFEYAFQECTALTSIPENLFANCPNITSFENTFKDCTALTNIPENLFTNCPNITSFTFTFSGCTALTNIPENLFVNCPNVTSFASTFSGCTALTNIPENLFANCPNVVKFNFTFNDCTALASIPENLFANCLKVTKFMGTFSGCSNLTGRSIPLWNRVEDGVSNNYEGTPNGAGCYAGAKKLEDYNEIPDYWKEESAPR